MDVLNGIDKRIYFQLKKIYPNMIVESLHKKDSSLYSQINKQSQNKKLTSKEYIESLGFSYRRKKKEVPSLEIILDAMVKLYPNKEIKNGIMEIRNNQTLYNQLSSFAKENNTTVNNILINNGFTIFRNMNSQINYDVSALKKLDKEYKSNFAQISKLIGTTRQNLSNKLTIKSEVPPFWQGHQLTKKEKELVLKMIEEESFFLDDTASDLSIRLYKHINNSYLFCLFVIDNDNKNIKCFFEDIPSSIHNELIKKNFHIYDEKDFEIRKELLKEETTKINKFGEYEVRLPAGSSIAATISSRIHKYFKSFSRADYIEYLGLKLIDGRNLTDEELKEILKHYLVDGQYVHIPSNDPQHARFANLASRRNFPSLKAFLEHLGFQYKRMRVTDTQDKVIEKIKSYYLVEKNKVYISTYDPLYGSLNGLALSRNKKNISELLAEWGFERIYLEDLPSNYEPYDWQKQLESKTFKVESDYQELLDELVIEENYVYLDLNSSLYNKLYVLSIRKGTTINNLLTEWGYQRVYIKGSPDDPDRILLSHFQTEDERLRVTEALDRIIDIQGELSRSTSTIQKLERSRKLATEMKKLYDYKCQICNYSEEGKYIPLIQKLDGTNYMEVHHIVPVSEYDKVEDDEARALDTYHNVIVVCPHHHRYLHYHEGGFDTIVEIEQELYFKSASGKEAKIFINFHLKTIKQTT